jgi:hypothetical protein
MVKGAKLMTLMMSQRMWSLDDPAVFAEAPGTASGPVTPSETAAGLWSSQPKSNAPSNALMAPAFNGLMMPSFLR